ncbi:MAG TPA: hypothetical protein VFT28_07845 [Gemmatimonadales bacterium]|nr:hypothetical protein [Gemmatimonadales bacterium]
MLARRFTQYGKALAIMSAIIQTEYMQLQRPAREIHQQNGVNAAGNRFRASSPTVPLLTERITTGGTSHLRSWDAPIDPAGAPSAATTARRVLVAREDASR